MTKTVSVQVYRLEKSRKLQTISVKETPYLRKLNFFIGQYKKYTKTLSEQIAKNPIYSTELKTEEAQSSLKLRELEIKFEREVLRIHDDANL